MKRAFTVVLGLLSLSCGSSTGPNAPSLLYASYSLTDVDGKALPAPYATDGSTLLAGLLTFPVDERPRGAGPAAGMVRYGLVIRRPDQQVSESTIDLEYTLAGGTLRINLCPPLALCLVSMELVGTVTAGATELLLTAHLAGQPGSVYRFVHWLPD